MLLLVQLTLLQKKFEGGGTGPLGPPPRSAPGSCTWQMKFNLSKCVTLKCYRSSSPIEIDYFINDHKLENVKHHPYLGITLDQTMSFIPHLNNITSKATRVLNFIK